MKGELFAGMTNPFAAGGPLVTRRRFAAALRKLSAAAKVFVGGRASRETLHGVVFAKGTSRHPFQVQLAAGVASVAPGAVVVPGTTSVFVLSADDLAVAAAGYVVVACQLRHKLMDGEAGGGIGSGFTGQAELGLSPELAFVTEADGGQMTPDFASVSCTYANVTIPLAYVDPETGYVEQFIYSSLAVWPAESGSGGSQPWQPDINFAEL